MSLRTIPVWRNSCRTNDDRQIENKLVFDDKSMDDKNGDSMNISPPMDSKWLLLKSEIIKFELVHVCLIGWVNHSELLRFFAESLIVLCSPICCRLSSPFSWPAVKYLILLFRIMRIWSDFASWNVESRTASISHSAIVKYSNFFFLRKSNGVNTGIKLPSNDNHSTLGNGINNCDGIDDFPLVKSTRFNSSLL